MNELAGHILGGYYLEEEVGRGAMGVVYRAKQLALGREVAIKVLPQGLARDASYVARFTREAQIIAGLNHPNIVQIYDAGQQQKLLYFAMEFVQGPTLASLLNLDGAIAPYFAVEYAAQIADALDAAYRERNVIHRDIKPENLMLNRWGKIKVMDFGLARAPGLQVITVARTLVGSIYYSSPEQIWGYTLDNRSDIYALGVVLYEMVCGRRPFTGRSMPEVTQAIIQGQLRPPRMHNAALPEALEQIILKALERDRHYRYREAGLMAHELRELHLPPPSNDPRASQSPYGQPQQKKMAQPPRRPQAAFPSYRATIEQQHTHRTPAVRPQSTQGFAPISVPPQQRAAQATQGFAPLSHGNTQPMFRQSSQGLDRLSPPSQQPVGPSQSTQGFTRMPAPDQQQYNTSPAQSTQNFSRLPAEQSQPAQGVPTTPILPVDGDGEQRVKNQDGSANSSQREKEEPGLSFWDQLHKLFKTPER
ncbi:hypothetical protein KDAU_05650 [Dictyobacter aurantiacus]|uniref:non-specific serine/threonine protein kinase n=2 Tax=Dictyobacter aurantiacus TaxID=1936993 RepID=A0A401Z8V2_9CHLR|nr:hypothetical protein KDAU_05650 [Dictyobacter aurantiacus]